VSGVEPLLYQWQRNGIDIPGANTADFIFQNAMLSDSGDLFRVIVSNPNGADTSLAATLSVTLDQRPVPEIFTPLTGTTYRAGDIIHFSGHATDYETGELMPSALRWRIDFHHNVHTHPFMISTTGITEGNFIIPNTGETAEDVWYRIHLTATDARGLSKTVTRDVIPLKTQFHVNTIPDHLPVSIDGGFVPAPVSTISVIGMMRRIEASASVVIGDSIFLFREWTDGVTTASRTFFAPDDTLTFTARYESYKVGKGTGLRGYFYDGPAFDPTFYEPYKVTKIDTTINFNWGYESPSEVHLGNDFWLVRWEGFVEPLLTGSYTFHVIGDDGFRLWVDEELLISAWIPQPATEWKGTIALEAGKQYPIKLEFFEEAYGAVCELYWSSSRIAKSIIPKSQLFPERTTSVDSQMMNKIPLTLFPNPVRTLLYVELKDQLKELKEIEIYNSPGQLVFQKTEDLNSAIIEINVGTLPAGAYWLKYKMKDGDSGAVQFMKW
ncbi:MAG: PA14 domain-containing protein, partial [Saprospiraceae bacterium]